MRERKTMKLTFLGTAAAEGYPAIWCRCERCETARARGGPNLRFRSSLLLNDDLLIDPGPDLVAASIRHGLALAEVQAILVTHLHDDHLDPTAIYWRGSGFAMPPLPEAQLYGTAASVARLHDREGTPLDPTQTRIAIHTVRHFARVTVQTGGTLPVDPRARPGRSRTADGAPDSSAVRRYDVLVLPASHARPEEEASFFAIRQVTGPECDGRTGLEFPTILYATDTGPFGEAAWEALSGLGRDGWRFGAVIIDATLGLGAPGKAHMNLDQVITHHAEIAARGLLQHGATQMAHHFSHNGTPPHEELGEHLAPHRIVPAFDGLVLHV